MKNQFVPETRPRYTPKLDQAISSSSESAFFSSLGTAPTIKQTTNHSSVVFETSSVVQVRTIRDKSFIFLCERDQLIIHPVPMSFFVVFCFCCLVMATGGTGVQAKWTPSSKAYDIIKFFEESGKVALVAYQ